MKAQTRERPRGRGRRERGGGRGRRCGEEGHAPGHAEPRIDVCESGEREREGEEEGEVGKHEAGHGAKCCCKAPGKRRALAWVR